MVGRSVAVKEERTEIRGCSGKVVFPPSKAKGRRIENQTDPRSLLAPSFQCQRLQLKAPSRESQRGWCVLRMSLDEAKGPRRGFRWLALLLCPKGSFVPPVLHAC